MHNSFHNHFRSASWVQGMSVPGQHRASQQSEGTGLAVLAGARGQDQISSCWAFFPPCSLSSDHKTSPSDLGDGGRSGQHCVIFAVGKILKSSCFSELCLGATLDLCDPEIRAGGDLENLGTMNAPHPWLKYFANSAKSPCWEGLPGTPMGLHTN